MAKISNYFDAVHFLGNHFILCNNIAAIDAEYYDGGQLGPWCEELDEDGDAVTPEIYQTFLTNCSDDDARYLADRFGLLFQYSPPSRCLVLVRSALRHNVERRFSC